MLHAPSAVGGGVKDVSAKHNRQRAFEQSNIFRARINESREHNSMLSIVGTNDSTEIYLNAESRGDRPTQLSNGYIYWQIGQDNLGLISDFSVYATKLSIEDIKTLYNSKAQITKNGILNADFFEEIEGNVKLPKNTSVVEATEFNENSDKVRVMKTNSVEAFSFNEWN